MEIFIYFVDTNSGLLNDLLLFLLFPYYIEDDVCSALFPPSLPCPFLFTLPFSSPSPQFFLLKFPQTPIASHLAKVIDYQANTSLEFLLDTNFLAIKLNSQHFVTSISNLNLLLYEECSIKGTVKHVSLKWV